MLIVFGESAFFVFISNFYLFSSTSMWFGFK